jgi:hypothetical protein
MRFTSAWETYMAHVARIAAGIERAPVSPGNPAFALNTQVRTQHDDMAWNSTTPYLSVLLAPRFLPRYLVVDPTTGYWWIDCATARANRDRPLGLPERPRALVAAYACRYRP